MAFYLLVVYVYAINITMARRATFSANTDHIRLQRIVSASIRNITMDMRFSIMKATRAINQCVAMVSALTKMASIGATVRQQIIRGHFAETLYAIKKVDHAIHSDSTNAFVKAITLATFANVTV